MTSISNRDWLMQLAHEAPDELAAWMGAEHVDGGFAKSAKRAAAVERLKDARYHTLADYVRAILGWGHEPHFEDCRDALIDLLTDGSCGQDADQGIRAEAPVRENLHDSSKETQKPRSREADSGNVSDSDGENLHVEQDTREKLEADASSFCDAFTDERIYQGLPTEAYTSLIKLLDRQAAITERECIDKRIADQIGAMWESQKIAELEDELRRSYDAQGAKAEELTLRGVRISELQGRVDKLTAERDGWRMRCGTLLDAAHAMLGFADAWDKEEGA